MALQTSTEEEITVRGTVQVVASEQSAFLQVVVEFQLEQMSETGHVEWSLLGFIHHTVCCGIGQVKCSQHAIRLPNKQVLIVRGHLHAPHGHWPIVVGVRFVK